MAYDTFNAWSLTGYLHYLYITSLSVQGPGWDNHPKIKELLKPVVGADDGIFWVTKEEFFELYDTIYVSASNMEEFLAGDSNPEVHKKAERRGRDRKLEAPAPVEEKKGTERAVKSKRVALL